MILKKEEANLLKEVKMSNEIKIRRLTLWKGLSVALGVLLIISIFTGGFGSLGGDGTKENVKQAQPAQERDSGDSGGTRGETNKAVDMKTLIDDDTVKGDADAKVTIVEWSDFECPFCTRFYTDTLGQIEKEYIDTGKVKFVYRDFPLNFHRNAQKSAEAAECAGEQGKFWEMHDMLFEKGVAGGVNSFKEFAKEIKLDVNEFDECLDSGEMADEVRKDMQDGGNVGVRGTPGFVINGQLVSGAQPFSVFKQLIDAELAK